MLLSGRAGPNAGNIQAVEAPIFSESMLSFMAGHSDSVVMLSTQKESISCMLKTQLMRVEPIIKCIKRCDLQIRQKYVPHLNFEYPAAKFSHTRPLFYGISTPQPVSGQCGPQFSHLVTNFSSCQVTGIRGDESSLAQKLIGYRPLRVISVQYKTPKQTGTWAASRDILGSKNSDTLLFAC